MDTRSTARVGRAAAIIAAALASFMIGLFAPVGPAVRADEPVALVVGVEGDAETQEVVPFSELANGETVDLGDRTRLVFVHYQRCEEVTAEHGRLTVRTGSYRLVGGRIVGRITRDCPKTGVTGSHHGVGGVVFRGPADVTVSPVARLVMTGPKATAVSRVRIRVPALAGEVTADVSGSVVDLGTLLHPARPGDVFDLDLIDRSGRSIGALAVSIGAGHRDVAVVRVD